MQHQESNSMFLATSKKYSLMQISQKSHGLLKLNDIMRFIVSMKKELMDIQQMSCGVKLWVISTWIKRQINWFLRRNLHQILSMSVNERWSRISAILSTPRLRNMYWNVASLHVLTRCVKARVMLSCLPQRNGIMQLMVEVYGKSLLLKK